MPTLFRILSLALLLMGGAPPAADAMKRYAEAGVSRLVIAAPGSNSGDAVKAVRDVAPVVEVGTKIN